MLVQDKAYLLLLMCLSMLCPVEMAALERAVRPAEQAMAYLNIRLKIRATHYGLASRIALAVVLVDILNVLAVMRGILSRMAMVGLMVVMAVHRLSKTQQMRLAVLAVYMVVVMVEMPIVLSIMVQMQPIMVLAAAVVPTIILIMKKSALEGLAIKV